MTLSDDVEISLLLDAIYHRFQYDFRGYGLASIRRRLIQACRVLGCTTFSALQDRVLHEPGAFSLVLSYLSVQVSDLFRDPIYFRTFRQQICPVLHTYPSLKIWIAGCATGEEVYSLAIVLEEEQLLSRTIVYATDINPEALRAAETGVYALERMKAFTENYQATGGTESLAKYYTADYQFAVFDRSLRRSVVFADHSLATDTCFGEMQVVSCRNVLIYFQRPLQERAIGLFGESLCRRGFLGLGMKESLRFSTAGAAFEPFAAEAKWYRHL